MLWVNQFLIFGPLLCIHAQFVCEKRADPLTPCLPDLPDENTNETKAYKDNQDNCSEEPITITINLQKGDNKSVDYKLNDPSEPNPKQDQNKHTFEE